MFTYVGLSLDVNYASFIRRLLAFFLLGSSAFLQRADAASFPCPKAKTEVERMICADPRLSAMDDDLSVLYRRRSALSSSPLLLEQQRKWIVERDHCLNVECISRAYIRRLAEFDGVSPTPQRKAKAKQCYILKKSDKNGVPSKPAAVCTALEENLNRLCDQPPMVCGLKVSPEFRDRIIFPKWTPTAVDNLDLLEKIVLAPWASEAGKAYGMPGWNERKPQLLLALEQHRLSVSTATLDLYNLGKPALTYRIDDGMCAANNPQLRERPALWNEVVTPANILTQQAPNIIEPLSRDFPVQLFGANEVFLFGGATYSFLMVGKEGYTNDFVVLAYAAQSHQKRKNRVEKKVVCTFEYNGSYDLK